MQLILIGFMGSGKTTVARKIAHAYQTNWIDVDRYIVQKEQRTINEIFAQEGQAAFRKMEYEALHELVQQDGIIATGGGVVDDAQTSFLLHQSHIPIIYLNGSFEAHWRRVSTNDKRPLVNQLGHDGLRDLYRERHPRYYRLANYTIFFQHKTLNMIAHEIRHQLPNIQRKMKRKKK